jgi:hypothetical protein
LAKQLDNVESEQIPQAHCESLHCALTGSQSRTKEMDKFTDVKLMELTSFLTVHMVEDNQVSEVVTNGLQQESHKSMLRIACGVLSEHNWLIIAIHYTGNDISGFFNLFQHAPSDFFIRKNAKICLVLQKENSFLVNKLQEIMQQVVGNPQLQFFVGKVRIFFHVFGEV